MYEVTFNLSHNEKDCGGGTITADTLFDLWTVLENGIPNAAFPASGLMRRISQSFEDDLRKENT